MFSLTVLFSLMIGVAFPNQYPAVDAVKDFPGYWPEDHLPSATEVFSTSLGVISLRGLYTKTVNGVLVLSFIFLTMIVLSSLAYLVPVLVVVYVIMNFGVVCLATTSWNVFLAAGSLVALSSSILPVVWVKLTAMLVGAAIEHDKTTEGWEKVFVRTFESIHNLSDSDVLSPVHFEGRVFTPSTIAVGDRDDIHIRFAVATYWLYCPTIKDSVTTTGGCIIVGSLAMFRTLYLFCRLHLKIASLTFKIIWSFLFLVIFASPRTIETLGDMVAWVLVIIFNPYRSWFKKSTYVDLHKFLRLLLLWVAIRLCGMALNVGLLSLGSKPRTAGVSVSKERLISVWNNAIIDFTRKIDEVSIPNFIRSLPDRFDRDAINEANEILHELGWPKAPLVTDVHSEIPLNRDGYRSWWIGGTSIHKAFKLCLYQWMRHYPI